MAFVAAAVVAAPIRAQANFLQLNIRNTDIKMNPPRNVWNDHLEGWAGLVAADARQLPRLCPSALTRLPHVRIQRCPDGRHHRRTHQLWQRILRHLQLSVRRCCSGSLQAQEPAAHAH